MAFKFRDRKGELHDTLPDVVLPVGLLIGDSNGFGWNSAIAGVDLPNGGAPVDNATVWSNWGNLGSGEDLSDAGTGTPLGRNRILPVSLGSIHQLTPDLGSRAGALPYAAIGPEYTLGLSRESQLMARYLGTPPSFFWGLVKHGVNGATWAADAAGSLGGWHPEDSQTLTLALDLTGAGETSIVVDESPLDIPATGSLRVQLDSGSYMRIAYTAFAGSTFTVAATDFTGDNATAPRAVLAGGGLFTSAMQNLKEFQTFAASLPAGYRLALDAIYCVITGADALQDTGVWGVVGNIRRFQVEAQAVLGLASLPPLVVTRPLAGSIANYTEERVRVFRDQMARAERLLPNISWVEVDDLPRQVDGVHFCAQGQVTLGRRLADARNEMVAPIEELP